MAISLQKGQKISLNKEAGGELTQVKLGLGWDVAQGPQDKKGGFLGKLFGGGSGGDSIDLDASCIMFDAKKQAVDAIWFGQLQSKDGSIVHTGDNRTGDGDVNDFIIAIAITSTIVACMNDTTIFGFKLAKPNSIDGLLIGIEHDA